MPNDQLFGSIVTGPGGAGAATVTLTGSVRGDIPPETYVAQSTLPRAARPAIDLDRREGVIPGLERAARARPRPLCVDGRRARALVPAPDADAIACDAGALEGHRLVAVVDRGERRSLRDDEEHRPAELEELVELMPGVVRFELPGSGREAAEMTDGLRPVPDARAAERGMPTAHRVEVDAVRPALERAERGDRTRRETERDGRHLVVIMIVVVVVVTRLRSRGGERRRRRRRGGFRRLGRCGRGR